MKTTTNRSRKNGQYSFEGSFERVCVCGRTLGVHDADAPHGFGDFSMEQLPETHPGFDQECLKFKLAKKKAA